MASVATIVGPLGNQYLPSDVEGGRLLSVDDARIRTFVDHEYARVVATVDLVCGSTATAEDAVQEALARAWEREARGDSIENLAAWVTTAAMNLARSQMRRWRCERRLQSRMLTPPSTTDSPATAGDGVAVRAALAQLPRRQREVTALRYYLGLDVREIAKHLGIGEGTVKAQLHRARASLLAVLGDDEGDEHD